MKKRYLKSVVLKDMQEKMVFIGGPRQVGKTTFAVGFIDNFYEDHPAYLNWDNITDHSRLIKGELPPRQKLIVLDEIHKYARWRNLVKGFFDTHKSSVSFLITGSARLDYYRKGGDSLQGRTYYYRLHPFSLRELNPRPGEKDLEELIKWGGFPEPFLKGNEVFSRRWQKDRIARVIYDDIRDLERVREISLLELLIEELPDRVGSPLSIRNLRETLQVAHYSVERWISIFERMYLVFRISPFGSPRIRAVKKEQKLYFWDWSQVEDEGARFENLVACQLLKYCHFLEDTEGHRMELRFLRDKDKREIDFVVIKNKKPLFAVECKTGEKTVNSAVYYYRERTAIPKFYQVHLGKKDYGNADTSVRMIPFSKFCMELKLP